MRVEIHDIHKAFLKWPVLRGISLNLESGRAIALVGESGCGKTTLAKIMMKMENLDSGRITVDGQEIHLQDFKRGENIFQMVFQDPHSSLNPRWTIKQILMEPLNARSITGEKAQQAIAEILKQVGFDTSVLPRVCTSFSGGQKQRLVIARALLMDPKFLLCDEPVSALDVSIQGQVLNVLDKLKKERNLGFLFISHDLSVVRAFADEVAILYLGRIVENGPVDQVLEKPRHPYTKLLLDCIPEIDHEWKPWASLEKGEVMSPLDLASGKHRGCTFAKRCDFATERCRTEDPQWTATTNESGFECFNPLA